MKPTTALLGLASPLLLFTGTSANVLINGAAAKNMTKYDHLVRIGVYPSMDPDMISVKKGDTVAFVFMADKHSVATGYWEPVVDNYFGCFPSIPKTKYKFWSGIVDIKEPGDHIFVTKIPDNAEFPIPLYSTHPKAGCRAGMVGMIFPHEWDLQDKIWTLSGYKGKCLNTLYMKSPDKDNKRWGGKLGKIKSPKGE